MYIRERSFVPIPSPEDTYYTVIGDELKLESFKIGIGALALSELNNGHTEYSDQDLGALINELASGGTRQFTILHEEASSVFRSLLANFDEHSSFNRRAQTLMLRASTGHITTQAMMAELRSLQDATNVIVAADAVAINDYLGVMTDDGVKVEDYPLDDTDWVSKMLEPGYAATIGADTARIKLQWVFEPGHSDTFGNVPKGLQHTELGSLTDGAYVPIATVLHASHSARVPSELE